MGIDALCGQSAWKQTPECLAPSTGADRPSRRRQRCSSCCCCWCCWCMMMMLMMMMNIGKWWRQSSAVNFQTVVNLLLSGVYTVLQRTEKDGCILGVVQTTVIPWTGSIPTITELLNVADDSSFLMLVFWVFRELYIVCMSVYIAVCNL